MDRPSCIPGTYQPQHRPNDNQLQWPGPLPGVHGCVFDRGIGFRASTLNQVIPIVTLLVTLLVPTNLSRHFPNIKSTRSQSSSRCSREFAEHLPLCRDHNLPMKPLSTVLTCIWVTSIFWPPRGWSIRKTATILVPQAQGNWIARWRKFAGPW